MKKILSFIVLLSFSSFAFSAEDGTGQGESMDSFDLDLYGYCSEVIKAEDGTGQIKAEDGTGQGKAEDGTGQGQLSDPVVSICNQLLK